MAREVVRPATRAEWRAWLEANHTRGTGVQVVYPRARSQVTGPTYVDIVEECLCFGWIDGNLQPVDDALTSNWVSPRRRGSIWAASNKGRVERLTAAGLMAPPGAAAVQRAKADGSWDALTAVDDLVVPEELAAAFDRNPGARRRYDALPPSQQRQILWWVHSAKRPETRVRRAELAAVRTLAGLRPDQWPRNVGVDP